MDKEISGLERALLLRRSQCLSVAAARRLDLKIVLVVDDAKALFDPYTRDRMEHVLHVFAVGDGKAIDAQGVHDVEVIEARYLRANQPNSTIRLISLSGEQQLNSFVSPSWDYSLSPVSDEEIDAVWSDFLNEYPGYASGESVVCL